MNERDKSDDRVAEAVALISKKWHPVIIQTLLDAGPMRFNELQSDIEDVSAKVLTDSLEDLADNDLVERRVLSESPKRVEYDLTRSGRELQAVIESLADWGKRNLGESTRPNVLVVDDDPRLAQMHAGWLSQEYDVETAYNGKQAISSLSQAVDVVLLDRRMPGLSGDELLEKIRDADIDCRVVLLTAVEPDVDIAEMPFDAYILKPGDAETVRSVVEEVLDRSSAEEAVLEFCSLRARRALLEARLTPGERESSEEYQRLLDRLESIRSDIGEGNSSPKDRIRSLIDAAYD